MIVWAVICTYASFAACLHIYSKRLVEIVILPKEQEWVFPWLLIRLQRRAEITEWSENAQGNWSLVTCGYVWVVLSIFWCCNIDEAVMKTRSYSLQSPIINSSVKDVSRWCFTLNPWLQWYQSAVYGKLVIIFRVWSHWSSMLLTWCFFSTRKCHMSKEKACRNTTSCLVG